MHEKLEIQLQIFNSIAANALYNFDRDTLESALHSYVNFKEIEAIQVFDSQEEPFLCIYKKIFENMERTIGQIRPDLHAGCVDISECLCS